MVLQHLTSTAAWGSLNRVILTFTYFILFSFLGLGDFKCNASKKTNKQKIASVQFKTVCLLAEDFTFQEEKMLM